MKTVIKAPIKQSRR